MVGVLWVVGGCVGGGCLLLFIQFSLVASGVVASSLA